MTDPMIIFQEPAAFSLVAGVGGLETTSEFASVYDIKHGRQPVVKSWEYVACSVDPSGAAGGTGTLDIRVRPHPLMAWSEVIPLADWTRTSDPDVATFWIIELRALSCTVGNLSRGVPDMRIRLARNDVDVGVRCFVGGGAIRSDEGALR